MRQLDSMPERDHQRWATVRRPEPSGSRPRLWTNWVAWCAATLCVVLFVRTLDLRAIAAELRTASPGGVAVCLLGNLAVLPLMTEQWRRLLTTRARWGAVWECVSQSMAAMNTLPFGGGHAAAVGIMAGQRLTSVGGAVSLLAVEQLCDGVTKLVVLFAAMVVAPVAVGWQRTAWIAGSVTMLGFVVAFAIAWNPRREGSSARMLGRWSKHLEIMRRPIALLEAIGLSFGMKLTTLFAIFAAQRSFGVELPFTATPVVLAAILLSTSVALTPGSLGVFEVAVAGAYRLLGVPTPVAAALAVVQHACFAAATIVPGYLVIAWRMIAPHAIAARRE